MKLGNFDTSKKVLIIAEIGNNHEGNFDLAVEMIRKAALAGADAVKFQTFKTENFISRLEKDRFARLKKFELPFEKVKALSEEAKKNSVIFLSTPFDLESAEFLNRIVPVFKIASGDNTFYPLLDFVASFGKPVILSTGLADIEQLRKPVAFLKSKNIELVLLHCACAYPVPDAEVNLKAIAALSKKFNCEAGYSDHSLGIDAAVLSSALGARVIEKHFTIDKNYSDFRDHALSADPEDFSLMVEKIRKAELLLGDGAKNVKDCEKANLTAARRSIVAAKDLRKGDFLSLSSLTWLRPGGGLPPGDEKKLIGKKMRRAVAAGEKILSEDIIE
jgi:sialic acid synthase SpsE